MSQVDFPEATFEGFSVVIAFLREEVLYNNYPCGGLSALSSGDAGMEAASLTSGETEMALGKSK